MPKRLFWLSIGTGVGVAATVAAQRKAKRMARAATPGGVADRLASTARHAGRAVRDAVGEGRAAMRDREAELRPPPGARAAAARPATRP